MKKLISTLVIAAAISSPVFAEKGHEHGDSKDQPMGGMMMGHEQMMAMHEHMQKMHDMMAKIKISGTNEEKALDAPPAACAKAGVTNILCSYLGP